MSQSKKIPTLRPSTATLGEAPRDRPSVHQLRQDAEARSIPGHPRTAAVENAEMRHEQLEVPVQFKSPSYFRTALHTEAARKGVTARWIIMKCVSDHPDFDVSVLPDDLFEDRRKLKK